MTRRCSSRQLAAGNPALRRRCSLNSLPFFHNLRRNHPVASHMILPGIRYCDELIHIVAAAVASDHLACAPRRMAAETHRSEPR